MFLLFILIDATGGCLERGEDRSPCIVWAVPTALAKACGEDPRGTVGHLNIIAVVITKAFDRAINKRRKGPLRVKRFCLNPPPLFLVLIGW